MIDQVKNTQSEAKLLYCRTVRGVSRPILSPSSLSMRKVQLRQGFTLIELLLVIGIIAILASIVIVAINPTKQLADARNAQRKSDVNTILNAVYQYAIDNSGAVPTTITTTLYQICSTDASSTDTTLTDAQCIDLDALTGSYIVRLPRDPSAPGGATGTGTSYTIYKTATNRIRVSAPLAEQSQTIYAEK